MPEERWGEKWQVGDRVTVWNHYEEPSRLRHGVIVNRSWGRERGKPIYWFTLQLEGVEGTWVFGPGALQVPEP
ncbi:hypothetical protein [Angustibacter sp. Root456]|uniref:hypothetical protein n=1 Tax=Angustibacter sp. Root456 TaxID=1736539 RepID=UPI0012FC31DA|nr:hypothetical protein [Angustibacter sp. Root456]